MKFQLKLLIVAIAVLIVVLIVALYTIDFLGPQAPHDLVLIARDSLGQAFNKQGIIITSGKIYLFKGTAINGSVGGTALGISGTNICTGSDSRISSLSNANGVLTYAGDDTISVRVRAYCHWNASQLEQQVLDLNSGINSVTCPSNYPKNSAEEVGCMIGFMQG